MAIFDKGGSESNTTIIASGTKVEGEFDITCKLHIDGEVLGLVKSSNVVIIGKEGSFSGELFSDKLIISGVFEGNAECERIELLKGGKIIGKIISKDLMVESGSIFEGESKIKKEKKVDSAS